MASCDDERALQPLVLIVHGLDNSPENNWQSMWASELSHCHRVGYDAKDRAPRKFWIDTLHQAISAADRPVVVVAHSIGCHALAWWAMRERPEIRRLVVGALLVAPPDLEADILHPHFTSFAPLVSERLPFYSIMAASTNDPFCRFDQAKRMARAWGSHLANAGPVGQIDARSGMGNWPYGRYLLNHLFAEIEHSGRMSGARAREIARRARITHAFR